VASADALLSWGRRQRERHSCVPISWASDPFPPAGADLPLLPYGCGRSYGDSCLNAGGTLLLTRGLNRFVELDRETGRLRCEAGVTLREILELVIPTGWFPAVLPGTSHVTVGGAIANDIHGKNHHVGGTFGASVEAIELLRSDGSRRECSRDREGGLFAATIAGLGLTGLVTRATLRLKRVSSPWIAAEAIRFRSLDEFDALVTESDRQYEYTVAWLDLAARETSGPGGIFFRGNHAQPDEARPGFPMAGRRVRLPADLPDWAISRTAARAFNWLYMNRPLARRSVVSPWAFFFPLDGIEGWNRAYGRRGFFQYQAVVPGRRAAEALRPLLDAIRAAPEVATLTVLKTMGDVRSPGIMSFPRPGLTLSVDFPDRGPETARFLSRLSTAATAAGGAVYPAKDAVMSGADFRASFPRWKEFSRHRDPGFSSGFWRRVMHE